MRESTRELGALLPRIGSSNAVSWPAFWLILLANLMLVLLGNAASLGQELPERLLIVAACQLAVFLPPLVVWSLWVRRATRPRPWLMLSAFAVGGLCRGLVVAPLEMALGLPDGQSAAMRIATSVTVMVVAFVTIAVAVDLTREAVAADAELVDYRRRTVLAAVELSQRIQRQRDAAVQEVEQELEARMRASTPGQLAGGLRRIVDDVVRPLSRVMLDEIPRVEDDARLRPEARRGWRMLLIEVGRSEPFTPPATEVLLIIAALPWIYVTLPGVLGVAECVVIAAVAAGVSLAWNAWFRRAPAMSPGLFSVVLTATATTVGLVWLAAGGLLLDVDQLPVAFAPVAFTIVTTWLLAGLRAAARRNARRRDELAQAIADRELALARARDAVRRDREDLAHALRGPLLGTLIANAMRIENELAAGASGERARGRVGGEVREVLAALGTSPEVRPLTATLRDLGVLWTGLAEVTWTLPDRVAADLDDDPTATALLARITIEACGSAVRRVGADRIDIEFGADEAAQAVWMAVTDNGDAYPHGDAGVVGRLLEQFALDWSRSRTDGANRLFARIRTREGQRPPAASV